MSPIGKPTPSVQVEPIEISGGLAKRVGIGDYVFLVFGMLCHFAMAASHALATMVNNTSANSNSSAGAMATSLDLTEPCSISRNVIPKAGLASVSFA